MHNSALTVKSFNGTSAGLTARVIIYGKILELLITGTTTQEITIQSDYFTVATLPNIIPYIPASGILKYCIYNSSIYGQISIQVTTGQILIGYTRSISTGSSTNIPSGTPIYIKETFVIN